MVAPLKEEQIKSAATLDCVKHRQSEEENKRIPEITNNREHKDKEKLWTK